MKLKKMFNKKNKINSNNNKMKIIKLEHWMCFQKLKNKIAYKIISLYYIKKIMFK